MTPLHTGARIGILGGGQLGRMLSLAAAKLGFDVSIYCPEPDCPAARVSHEHILADYLDLETLLAWARSCDIITYEFENVPVLAAQTLLGAGILVRPGALPLEVSQDRLREKAFLSESCNIPTAPFRAIASDTDIDAALRELGGEGILKTRRDGYDGKGQARVALGDDYAEAHKALGNQPAILEALIPFRAEISILIARAPNGETRCYEAPLNQHINGILKRSTVPSGLSDAIFGQASAAAERLATALNYIGVLALEFFVLEEDSLLANEFAPRVHNSGHWTPEACVTGQFEQHIRAICGWPLGAVTRTGAVEMTNLLGAEAAQAHKALTPNESLTLYGKYEAKPGRKMGHLIRRF